MYRFVDQFFQTLVKCRLQFYICSFWLNIDVECRPEAETIVDSHFAIYVILYLLTQFFFFWIVKI